MSNTPDKDCKNYSKGIPHPMQSSSSEITGITNLVGVVTGAITVTFSR